MIILYQPLSDLTRDLMVYVLLYASLQDPFKRSTTNISLKRNACHLMLSPKLSLAAGLGLAGQGDRNVQSYYSIQVSR